MLGLVGLQGVIGYSQYFSGLPAGLVWFHVSGSVLIWIAALRLMFATRDRGAVPSTTAPTTTGPSAADELGRVGRPLTVPAEP